MASALNNVTTADNYTAANTLVFTGSRVNFIISNASAFVQLTDMDNNAGQEVFYPPGAYSLKRGVRAAAVRSGKAATPAQVTLEIIP